MSKITRNGRVVKRRIYQREADLIYELFELYRYDIDRRQLRVGMNVELEHGSMNKLTNITDDDLITTAKIAIAHLREVPDYYIRLKKYVER